MLELVDHLDFLDLLVRLDQLVFQVQVVYHQLAVLLVLVFHVLLTLLFVLDLDLLYPDFYRICY